jgi:cation transporter-like permease
MGVNMEDEKFKLTYYVTMMVSITLCACLVAMVVALLIGLWSKEVDNAEIFKMLSPALMTILGAAVGVMAGVKLSQKEKCKED